MTTTARGLTRFPFRRTTLATAAVLLTTGVLAVASAGPPSSGPTFGPHAAKALSWKQIVTSHAPSLRNWFGMAFDAADNYTVLYGGYDPSIGSFYWDTWEYLGGVWTQLSPAYHPSASSGLKMVYDPVLKGVVAFGGESPYGGTYYSDTWLFQNGSWTQLFPTTSPSPRSQYAMAYDAADSEIVLFGGSAGGSNDYSDTWTFNGTTWARVVTAVHPQGRLFANMAYDAKSGKTLLAGGINQTSGPYNATWTFSGGTWKRLSHSDFPGRQHTPIATLANGTPIFFGGQSPTTPWGLYNTTYEFFGGKWHHVRVANAPAPRSNGGLVYDAIDGHLLMFGGGIYGSMWNQTYILR
ncbi:MAG TPA: kelch repeat-containing protein [Thermoplasmata archaeon]|nr:kelch repeat-containing protein [Thermoplasmata archaeon]